jgi:hypothetical protein
LCAFLSNVKFKSLGTNVQTIDFANKGLFSILGSSCSSGWGFRVDSSRDRKQTFLFRTAQRSKRKIQRPEWRGYSCFHCFGITYMIFVFLLKYFTFRRHIFAGVSEEIIIKFTVHQYWTFNNCVCNLCIENRIDKHIIKILR